jgi:hypothetical protein
MIINFYVVTWSVRVPGESEEDARANAEKLLEQGRIEPQVNLDQVE